MIFGLKNLIRRWRMFILVILAGVIAACIENSEDSKEDSFPVYSGDDLGLRFGENEITVKVWSPQATDMRLRLYSSGEVSDTALETIAMKKGESGVWSTELPLSKQGLYYTVSAKHGENWSEEVPDPYAKAVGTNGLRGQIIDPSTINPPGWDSDASPDLKSTADIILYELHIRDFSIDENSGMKNKGKYLAFTETGTVNPDGLPTGVDHLRELGITHVHLLPSFDFSSIDESRLSEEQYNWGYDPQNYNVPEGSYSSNPADGAVRIKEFKSMVKALHDAGIRVVMDVVYNHTSRMDGLSFEELVPGYYYRIDAKGQPSNASGCGNEVASEKPMVRKFIVESLKYWMNEYHIDGFRFDLMGIHDIETMKEIERELHAVRPDVFLYGEGWTAADSPLHESERALKGNMKEVSGIAAFSDEIRDGIKGHWSSHESKGFVSGDSTLKESVKFGVAGGVDHPGIDYEEVNNSKKAWANDPTQCIVYVSCHDNHTLYDKLVIANPEASEEEIRKMHRLSNFIVLTSQGVPFLHAGVEFYRTKKGVENSYQSPDSINQINWADKTKHSDLVEFYKSLIAFRNSHPALKMGDAELIRSNLSFPETSSDLLVYEVSDYPVEGDRLLIASNGGKSGAKLKLPEGKWEVAFTVNSKRVASATESGKVNVESLEGIVFQAAK